MAELLDLVSAYWRYHDLAQGERGERLAAEEFRWALDAVNEALEGDQPITILDALLSVPQADPCFLGAGLVEDLLTSNPDAWASLLAERCRSSERWRAVLACVWVDNAERQHAEPLAPYLKPYG